MPVRAIPDEAATIRFLRLRRDLKAAWKVDTYLPIHDWRRRRWVRQGVKHFRAELDRSGPFTQPSRSAGL